MIMHMGRFIALTLLSLAMVQSGLAQIRIIPREKIESVSNPRLSADSAVLSFETLRIVAEVMNEDDPPKTFFYRFENTGHEPISVTRLVSTCSCASAKAGRNVIGPGEKGEIAVRYDPKGHPGKFERRVFVYTDEGNAPAAVLKLVVDVENGADLSGIWPVQMGSIRMRRSEVTFVEGVRAVEKLRFINLSGRELALTCEEAFLPECLSFRSEPEMVKDGEEGEMIISYDPERYCGREVSKVMLKGLDVPPSRSSVTVVIRKKTENE